MMTILNFREAGTAGLLCCLLWATGAQASVTFSIGYAAQQDIGTADAYSAFAPFTATSFPYKPYLPPNPDADGGCDTDAFSNFGGPSAGPSGITTCGDTLIFNGATSGTLDTITNLSDTSSPNGTGAEFHVEDSSGTGTVNSFLPETLSVGGESNTFDLPYTVTFTSTADSFQIPAFDIAVCIPNASGSGCTNYYITSPGTLGLDRNGSDDDDWAFETTLVGCVNTSDTGCETTPSSTVISFLTPDPPLAAVPEPSTLAVLLFGVIAAGTLHSGRRSS